MLRVYLYGDAAEGSTYDSSDCERAVVLQSVRSVWTDELCVVHLSEGGSDKLQRLGNTPTWIFHIKCCATYGVQWSILSIYS